MNKQFALDYAIDKTLHDSYNKAQDAGNEADMEKYRSMYNDEFAKYMKGKEEDYLLLYRLYKSARERGNDYIDFAEPYQYRGTEKLYEALQKYEVEKITFSSTWSSAIETAWELIQSGCTLEGMIEINGTTAETFSEEYERIPAYLFRVS